MCAARARTGASRFASTTPASASHPRIWPGSSTSTSRPSSRHRHRAVAGVSHRAAPQRRHRRRIDARRRHHLHHQDAESARRAFVNEPVEASRNGPPEETGARGTHLTQPRVGAATIESGRARFPPADRGDARQRRQRVRQGPCEHRARDAGARCRRPPPPRIVERFPTIRCPTIEPSPVENALTTPPLRAPARPPRHA